jgi:hypothetical protein
MRLLFLQNCGMMDFMRSEMSRTPSGRQEARVRSTCDGFSLSEDSRTPITKKSSIFYFPLVSM